MKRSEKLLCVFLLVLLVGPVVITLDAASQWGLDRAVGRTHFRANNPPNCRNFYNQGLSKQWQECMGVGPK